MMHATTRIALAALLACGLSGARVSAQTPPATAKPTQSPSTPSGTAKPAPPAPAPASTSTTAKPAEPSAVETNPLLGPTAKPAAGTAKPAAPVVPVQAPLPDDYVIGPDDILIVVFWREKDLSSEVTVRPDGKISIPLLQDVDAAGLTPEQLRDKLNEQAQRFVEDPNATVVVKEINSRRVYITGQVGKAGPYRLTAPTTVVQLIAMAGGLLEYADQENITIMRMENGAPTSYRFNYKDIAHRRNLKQNILLKPGDTVVVP